MGVDNRYHHPAGAVETWRGPDGAVASLPLSETDEHGCVLVHPDVIRNLLQRAGFEHIPTTIERR